MQQYILFLFYHTPGFSRMNANGQQLAAVFFLGDLRALPFLSAQKVIESTARSAPRPPPKKNMAASCKLSFRAFIF